MPTAQEVRGSLMGMNATDIPEEGNEIARLAEESKIHIFNVGPYTHTVRHPLVGCLTIPACEDGEECSKAAIVRGMVPYAVMVDMGETGRKGELRHESGRLVAIDLIGIGPYRSPSSDLMKWGVFIAAEDTFNATKTIQYKTGKNASLNVPGWVTKGKVSATPTKKEIAEARKALERTDVALIKEADQFWNKGPQHHDNITEQHREALRRRKQSRPWDNPIETLTECPGCGEKVRPGVKKHVACGWRFDLNGFEGDKQAPKTA